MFIYSCDMNTWDVTRLSKSQKALAYSSCSCFCYAFIKFCNILCVYFISQYINMDNHFILLKYTVYIYSTGTCSENFECRPVKISSSEGTRKIFQVCTTWVRPPGAAQREHIPVCIVEMNTRNELISTCRHRKKHLLCNH